jgi:hypothetical protein
LHVCGCFARAVALAAMAFGALPANAASVPQLVWAERAEDPVSKTLPHYRFALAGDWNTRTATTVEARWSIVVRSLDGARGRKIHAASVALGDQPPGTSHDGRLTQLRPIAERWVSAPDWMQSARKIHQQGVPFLRPWENSRMFLSLGVNSRGVPGIYLVQKTPH